MVCAHHYRAYIKRITVTIHASRPGIIIGKGGQEVDRIREELKKLTNHEVQINILEIRNTRLDAAIVGESSLTQLEARINYRRAIKSAIQSTMRAGARRNQSSYLRSFEWC
ncbi:MAG: KH domain-containing protein [Saprospiraceae bacterium]